MAFDWQAYLKLAKALSLAKDEASLRSAVSRSYYCAYNLAFLRARANQYRLPNDGSGGSHELLWDLYERNNNEACKRLFLLGPRMKRRRVKADYHDHFAKIDDEVKGAIEDAEAVVAIIATLPPNLPQNIPRKFSY